MSRLYSVFLHIFIIQLVLAGTYNTVNVIDCHTMSDVCPLSNVLYRCTTLFSGLVLIYFLIYILFLEEFPSVVCYEERRT